MHSKIKEVRMQLGLSETQVSSLLNISSYKYRRYENGNLSLPVEILVLLSIMYDISIDLLVFDKYSFETILNEESIIRLLNISQKELLATLECNMSRYCTFDCVKINYRVVKNILADLLKNFSTNLQEFRCSQLMEISEISSLLQVDMDYYLHLERGKMWPTVINLINISSIFYRTIDSMFGIE